MDSEKLEAVLRNPNLVLNSESELFKLLNEIKETRNDDISSLFACLHLEYLEINEVQKFIEIVSTENFGILCRRLMYPIDHSIQKNACDELINNESAYTFEYLAKEDQKRFVGKD